MNKKTLTIVEGAVTVLLGVLIAVFGGVSTLSLYFGILFIVAGVGTLAFVFVAMTKTGVLGFATTFFGCAATTLGIAMLVNGSLFATVIYVVTLLIIAGGAALIIFGVWSIVKSALFYGLGQAVAGAAAITIALLYIFVAGFQKFFWIVVGILVAAYGLYVIITALASKKSKKSKK